MTHKRRVRVRLKARDRAELRQSFAPCISRRGVFISSERVLPVGTELEVTIELATGQAVLTGPAVVRAVRSHDRTCPGLALRVMWNSECLPLVEELTQSRTESNDLHSDLQLDSAPPGGSDGLSKLGPPAEVARPTPNPRHDSAATVVDQPAPPLAAAPSSPPLVGSPTRSDRPVPAKVVVGVPDETAEERSAAATAFDRPVPDAPAWPAAPTARVDPPAAAVTEADREIPPALSEAAPTVEAQAPGYADSLALQAPTPAPSVLPPAPDLSSLSQDLLVDDLIPSSPPPPTPAPAPKWPTSVADDLLFEAPVEVADSHEDLPVMVQSPSKTGDALAFTSPSGPSSIDLTSPILLGEPIESDISDLVDEPSAKTADLAIETSDLEGFEDEGEDPFGPSITQIVLRRAKTRAASVSTEYASNDPLSMDLRAERQAVLGRIELVRSAAEPDSDHPPWDVSTDDLEVFGGMAAVDFGHIDTRVAVMDGRPILCAGRMGPETASAAFVHPNGKIVVDQTALRKLPYDPTRGISGLSRLLGRSATYPGLDALLEATPARLERSVDGRLALAVPEGSFSLERLASLVLEEPRRAASRERAAQVERAFMVGRASRSLAHRASLRAAAEAGGWVVQGFVSSPLAVAAAYALPRALDEASYLVLDVGAGSTEAALVDIESGTATLIAVAHDETLGGESFDTLLADRLGREVEAVTGDLPTPDKGWLDLLEASEIAKVSLSRESTAHVHVARAEGAPGMTFDIEEELSRVEVEAVFEPLILRIRRMVEDLLTSVSRRPSQIDAVLLAGGQTRSAQIRSACRPFSATLVDISDRSTAVFGALLLHEAETQTVEALPRDLAIRGALGGAQVVMAAQSALPGRVTFHVDWVNEESRDWFLFEGFGPQLDTYEPVVHLRLGADGSGFAGRVAIQVIVDRDGGVRGIAKGEHGEIPLAIERHIPEPVLLRHLSRASRLGGEPQETVDLERGLFNRFMSRFR